MHLTLVIPSLEGGGAARVLVNMANNWAQKGHSVSLCSFEDGSAPPFYPVDARVRIKYVWRYKISANRLESIKNAVTRFNFLRKLLLEDKPDVIISFIHTANIRTLFSTMGSGVPVIVSERSSPAHDVQQPIWEWGRRLSYPLAATIVVQTLKAKEFFTGKLHDKTIVIPNPVLPPADTEGECPQLPRPTIVAVGRLDEEKNYPLMIDAFSQASESHPDWSLCIAGDGPLKQQLQSQIDRQGLKDRILLLGRVRDIGTFLNQAEAYVISSTFEGFPNSLCEAMAAGLPCISTNCPTGPPSIIRHNVNGLLTANRSVDEMSHAMDSIMGNSALRERLSKEAINILDELNEKLIMKVWEQAIQRVLPEELTP